MNLFRTFVFLIAFLPGLAASAQLSNVDAYTKDDPILAMMDSLLEAKYFECSNFTTDTCLLNVHHYNPAYIPVFDEFVYEARMAKLDAKSPFKLDYNPVVKSYIDVYANRRRSTVSRMLGLAQLYFPLFEQTLDKYDLPLELKYLAIVESALNPNAVSRSGATGLWQFMYPTGKMFGLNVTSYLDDRRDPIKSTIAACEYFQYLYKMFGDWHLVLAAYNGGPGTVNKAIRRAGGKMNYWEIRPYLPLETQGYVPAFIAVNYIMNYTKEHNLYPIAPKQVYFYTDTLQVKQPVSFQQLALALDMPLEDLQYLNPTYKSNYIPYADKGRNTLCLPIHKIGSFINNEDLIYSNSKPQERVFEPVLLAEKEVQKRHTVKKGETLTAIARKYNCTPTELKKWNRNTRDGIRPGEKLIVYSTVSSAVKTVPSTVVAKKEVKGEEVQVVKTDSAQAEEKAVAEATSPVQQVIAAAPKAVIKKPAVVYYTVQRGDTLWQIANKYNGVTVEELKKMNGLKNKPIKPGMKLKVAVNNG